MLPKQLLLIFTLSMCVTHLCFAADCTVPTKRESVDLWSTKSLLSPDLKWKFISKGPRSSEKSAALYIRSKDGAQQWKIGSIERDGTAFWSGDSKRLFLVDEYAADDTIIRVFDLTGRAPREIKGLDRNIRKVIFRHFSPNETTLWLIYPTACFTAGDSSSIFLAVDAPRVRKAESGTGKSLSLTLTVDLLTLEARELSFHKED